MKINFKNGRKFKHLGHVKILKFGMGRNKVKWINWVGRVILVEQFLLGRDLDGTNFMEEVHKYDFFL